MQAIRHPGPASAERASVVACRAHPVTVTLRAGQSFGDALADGFAALGFSAGYLRLEAVPMRRLCFVQPAPAPGDGHAAWYSATVTLGAGAVIRTGGVHLGLRDGQPFTHCHGIWAGPDGVGRMGHLLPQDSIVGADCAVAGWGISGARLEVAEDPETRFALFRPRADGDPRSGGGRALLCSLRPNQDLGQATAALAARHDMGSARIEGIGSLVGTQFADGPMLESYATEMLVTEGRVTGAGARISAASVGFDGRFAQGRLAAGRNAVCVTVELLLIGDR
ncbi:DUF296 domain-containing protein [Halovulum dunhuangense]|uniref:DUF296 domain-containing protein n=1 Tax=Halovulum dunhuangense TaxID=1505036 RepID=A0A849KXT1_9RHOB|nr:DUF296 domain-containing protein [Halovulum dunhuangense]